MDGRLVENRQGWCLMITLTRLTGAQFALNPDLVERVDCTPDTVITLVDGTKYLVSESLQEVTERVLEYRARIVAGASAIEAHDTSATRRARLSAVPTDDARDDARDDDGDDSRDDGLRDPDAAGTSGQYGDLSVIPLEPRTN
jgi:flagellar protein FlbD